MDTIETLRARIGDKVRYHTEQYVGNGALVSFDIHQPNPYRFEITNDGALVSPDTYRYDGDIKKVIFDTAPANNAALVIKYASNAFTDAELGRIYTDSGSDIDQSTMEALRRAMADQARLVSFQHGDRSASLSDIFRNLQDLLSSYERKYSNSGANQSGFVVGRRQLFDDRRDDRPSDISRLIGF